MHHPRLNRLFPLVFIIAFLGSFMACNLPSEGTSSPTPEGAPVPEGEPVSIPHNAIIEEFEGGFPGNWEHSDGWRIQEGRAVVANSGGFLFVLDEWVDFDLVTRLRIGDESLISVVFRATDEGAYHLVMEPEGIELGWDEQGELTSLATKGVRIDTDWHDIELMVRGGHIAIILNGVPTLEYQDTVERPRGSMGFIMHSGTGLEIERVEIIPQEGEIAGEFPSGEEGEEMPSYREEFPKVVVMEPPVASLITIGTPDEDFNTTVSGSPGAVALNALVTLSNLETTLTYFTRAGEDGSFNAEIFAPPGSAVQIKHNNPFLSRGEEEHFIANQHAGELLADWINATTGTILRVPFTGSSEDKTIPFTISGELMHESDGYWIFQGTLGPTVQAARDFHLTISGSLTITSSAFQEGVDLSKLRVWVHADLFRFFDQNGKQIPTKRWMVSDFMTPTGFPISRDSEWSPFVDPMMTTNWRQVSEDRIETDVTFEFWNEENIPLQPGTYSPHLIVELHEPFLGTTPRATNMRPGTIYSLGGGYMPVVQVGEPATPHLFWTLLTDTLDQATRGTVSREDKTNIGLIPLTSLQKNKFVVPMVDPHTDQPIPYRLEPFLPLIAFSDRGVPNSPIIPFAFPSGELKVSVQRPDGGTDELGPAPFVQSVNRTPAFPEGILRDNAGGGAIQDVYQLTTLDDIFDYTFDQYGHYVITMEGSIEDIWGNSYSGGGTYDVYVARKLKLYTGMLPTTPFEAGDSFAPTVQVYPRLPAEIALDFKLLRDSNPEDLYARLVTGTANDFGYFHPGSGFEPITLPGGGEYRVDITATYNDPDGTLWMGTTSWGNVVENTDTPLIGHGVRGTDHPDINKLWFFHKNTGFSGITHTNYPYYAGDIFWGEESDEAADIGGDAIMPMVSIQDTGGEVYDILRERWETRVHGMIEMHGGLEEAIQRGEVQLFSTTSTMWDLSWDPGSIDQYGYTYRSSQRPGARVHESLSEGGIPIAYWRYGATYGDQVGIEGDRPNDLKWQFGGAVFRDLKSNITHYAIYGSLWVLVPENDPLGPRVTPPFQGATGGPNGGPILTLKGKEIDLLFLPKSGAPGQIMQVGESFSFSGHVGPPLDSKLNVTITSPSGSTRVITGQANKIGYFYQPSDDFVVDEPGVWTVVVQVVHEGMTSAGPVGPPYPTGDVLGSEEGLYHFYVLPQGSSPIQLESPSPGFLKITDSPQVMEITGQIPSGMDDPSVHYTIAMPGTILEEGTASPSAGVFTVTYDPVRLHQDFPNLDLTAYNAYRPGLADQIWISILVGDASGQYAACSITLHGEEVFER